MYGNNPAGIDFRQFKPDWVSFRHSESKKLQKSFRLKLHYINPLRTPKGEAVEWMVVAKGTLILTRPEAPPNPVDVGVISRKASRNRGTKQPSKLDPFKPAITRRLECHRIYQRLRADDGYAGKRAGMAQGYSGNLKPHRSSKPKCAQMPRHSSLNPCSAPSCFNWWVAIDEWSVSNCRGTRPSAPASTSRPAQRQRGP